MYLAEIFSFVVNTEKTGGGTACGKVPLFPAATREDSGRSRALREKEEGN